MFKVLIPDGTFWCPSSGTSDDTLERLFKMRIRGSDQFKTVVALCAQDTEHQFATEVPEIEDHGKVMFGSEDQSQKF